MSATRQPIRIRGRILCELDERVSHSWRTVLAHQQNVPRRCWPLESEQLALGLWQTVSLVISPHAQAPHLDTWVSAAETAQRHRGSRDGTRSRRSRAAAIDQGTCDGWRTAWRKDRNGHGHTSQQMAVAGHIKATKRAVRERALKKSITKLENRRIKRQKPHRREL